MVLVVVVQTVCIDDESVSRYSVDLTRAVGDPTYCDGSERTCLRARPCGHARTQQCWKTPPISLSDSRPVRWRSAQETLRL